MEYLPLSRLCFPSVLPGCLQRFTFKPYLRQIYQHDTFRSKRPIVSSNTNQRERTHWNHKLPTTNLNTAAKIFLRTSYPNLTHLFPLIWFFEYLCLILFSDGCADKHFQPKQKVSKRFSPASIQIFTPQSSGHRNFSKDSFVYYAVAICFWFVASSPFSSCFTDDVPVLEITSCLDICCSTLHFVRLQSFNRTGRSPLSALSSIALLTATFTRRGSKVLPRPSLGF